MSLLTNILSLLGNNNLIPSIIPTITLALATLVVFDPILHTSTLLHQQNSPDILVALGLLILTPIIIMSYTLVALNTYIINLYSGYSFLHRFPFLQASQTRKAKQKVRKIEELRAQIVLLEQRKRKNVKDKELLESMKTSYYSAVTEYNQNFPPLYAGIMPTQLGNILRSSEAYAGTHYGLDAVAFWPLLIAVIPDSYQEKINSARNELSFLLNMSFLSIIFFIACGIAAILTSPNLAYENYYLVPMSVSLLLVQFFYRAALYSASSYGSISRSAFDLYRLELLEKFRIKLPKDSVEEFYVWQNIGELIVLGQESLNFMPLKYYGQNSKKGT